MAPSCQRGPAVQPPVTGPSSGPPSMMGSPTSARTARLPAAFSAPRAVSSTFAMCARLTRSVPSLPWMPGSGRPRSRSSPGRTQTVGQRALRAPRWGNVPAPPRLRPLRSLRTRCSPNAAVCPRRRSPRTAGTRPAAPTRTSHGGGPHLNTTIGIGAGWPDGTPTPTCPGVAGHGNWAEVPRGGGAASGEGGVDRARCRRLRGRGPAGVSRRPPEPCPAACRSPPGPRPPASPRGVRGPR